MTVSNSTPILRTKTFSWLNSNGALSELSSISNGFILGSANSAQGTIISALLLPAPEWNSTALDDPWVLGEDIIKDLSTEFNVSESLNITGSTLSVDALVNTGILALVVSSESLSPQSLLLGLYELDGTPEIRWSSLLPNEQISGLLNFKIGTSERLHTFGSNLEGDGVITTAYSLLPTNSLAAIASQWRAFITGKDDIDATASDADLISFANDETKFNLVQVSSIQASTNTGLIPNGDSDVLLSVLNPDGELVWEKLFGNASIEQNARVAVTNNGNIIVGSVLSGSLGLNPAAGAQDIGLASYTSSGTLLWQKLLGDGGDQILTDITVAPDGTILVLGLTNGSSTGLYGQLRLGDGVDFDSFITAYSASGNRLWTHQFGTTGEDIALAMDWLPSGEGTLVVVGSQASLESPENPTAWVELLEIPATADLPKTLLPPSSPSLNWLSADFDPTLNIPLAVLSSTAGPGWQLQLQGISEPGNEVLIRTSLGSSVGSVVADSASGGWSTSLRFDQLTAAQLGQGFVVVQARNSQGLLSDPFATPVLFTGTGLVGDLPQVLPIDPDGPSGDLPPALLQRQITRLGFGPLTSAGQRVLVDYTGTLFSNTNKFDSSLNPGRQPFNFTLGAGQVISGWDLGLQGLPLGSEVRVVIPPSLAYGERDTTSIPANSTLVFDVELRADLTVPEVFLRDVVWPVFFTDSYAATNERLLISERNDLIGLAILKGPGDGGINEDELTVKPISGYSSGYPLLVMGFRGNDKLSSLSQPVLAFGEDGNDHLSSVDSPYAFLDGGDGNDNFEPGSILTWVNGGSGIDSVNLPLGEWRQLSKGLVATEPFRELGRYENSKLVELLYIQSVETIIGDLESFRSLLQSANDFGLTQTTLFLSNDIVSANELNQLLLIGGNSINASNVIKISGSFDEVNSIYLAASSGRITGLGDEAITLSGNTSVANANIISAATSGVVTATITEGALATLANLSSDGPFNAYMITVTDKTVAASALTTLNGKTSLDVVVTAVNTIDGTEAVLNTLYSAKADFIGLDNEVLILTDTSISASQLLSLAKITSGAINVPELSELTGNASERNRVFNASGIFTSLKDNQSPAVSSLTGFPADGTYGANQRLDFKLLFDEPLIVTGVPILPLSDGLLANYNQELSEPSQGLLAFSYSPKAGDYSRDLSIAPGLIALASDVSITDKIGNYAQIISPILSSSVVVDAVAPDLLRLDARGGTYRLNENLRINLIFNEPVRWKTDQDLLPVLKLSDGLQATWISPPSTAEFNNTHGFDLLIGPSTPDVMLLKVLGFADGLGGFYDSSGNQLLTNQAVAWHFPEPISISHAEIPWNLDVDGDNKVTALGDGLMIIRKLFGPAFSGTNLTSKAISPDASRNSTEIHAYIQQAIDQGFLDVDRDGKTTALGDGLMVIRQLFGNAFSGEALINKAISPGSAFIPQGQTFSGLDSATKILVADQVRGAIVDLYPNI